MVNLGGSTERRGSEATVGLSRGISASDYAIASEILAAPERMIEYRLCARLGVASVAAIAPLLRERLPHLEDNRGFKIWVGGEVARVMKALGYQILQRRGRVPWGNYFTYGTVWAPPAEAQSRPSGSEPSG